MPLLTGEASQLRVLNHGFVRLVDMMGSDQMICDAARLSYANSKRKMLTDDAKLIDYLMEHRHTSPFEQVVFTFHAKMPIFVARQWVRHRTARLNEFSGRYSEMRDEFWEPELEDLKIQSTTNKQGTGDEQIASSRMCQDAMIEHNRHCYGTYQALLQEGMAKELARTVLPLSAYTEWYWQMDLHNLFHFMDLRLDSHAQKQIRVYAEAMYKLIKPYVPMAVESFERHVLNATKFSSDETQVLRNLFKEIMVQEPGFAKVLMDQMLEQECFQASNNRKVKGFFEKLGIDVA